MDIEKLETGQLITDEVLLVAEARLGVDRRGQNYYSLTLNAEGGRQIEGKIWSDNIGADVLPGWGIEVLARVDEYRGAKQLNIQRYKLLSPEKHDLGAFVRQADVDVDRAFETLFNWEGEEHEDALFKRLMAELHGNRSFAAAFKESPAASRHHHNYQGGLAEHTLEVWNLADRIGGLFPGRLDREVLLAGAALHDIGKVNSYRLVSGISEPTEAGELLDHVFISASMVSNLWDSVVKPEVPAGQADRAAQRKNLLLHIILSHHGRMEWGAPVLPRAPEALLIHYCDVLSASLHKCFTALEAVPEGAQWTDPVYVMDHARRMFVPSEGHVQTEGED